METTKQFWRLPFAQWQVNYETEIDVKKASGKKFSPSYVPYHDVNALLRKLCPSLVFVVDEVLPFGDEDECTYMIKCRLYDQESGLYSQQYMVPVMQHGASAHGAIRNPDTRQISDSIKRAFVRVVAEETGIGYSLWTQIDLDPYEEAETEAPAKRRRSKKEELPFDDDIDDLLEDDLDDDLDDDEVDEAPRSRRSRNFSRKGGRR